VIGNHRPGRDWNTCGQAAVATVMARFGVGPFVPWLPPLTDAEAIDQVCLGFPPDVPLGLGSSAPRLAACLRGAGLEVEHVHSGWFGRGAGTALERVRAHLGRDLPAIVCLDQGLLGGPAWSAHWAVALGLDGDRVRLGNAGPSAELPLAAFVRAWRCRHLPFTHNHCALLVRR
jgi:hypothetical protein